MTLRTKSVFIAMVFAAAAAAQAQEPAAGARQGGGRQGGAARPAPPQPAPLFFKEAWKPGSAAVAATQAIVANPDLQLSVYGKTPSQPEVNDEGGVAHVWTGLCSPACAVTLKHKASFADLTGKARIKWYAKTSGFHEIRPVVKLADGTYIAGNRGISTDGEFLLVEVVFAGMRWYKLDPVKVVVTSEVKNPDFSKVDEVGLVTLAPGGGHGVAGSANLSTVELFARTVPR